LSIGELVVRVEHVLGGGIDRLDTHQPALLFRL
jgi:hypothetical protein